MPRDDRVDAITDDDGSAGDESARYARGLRGGCDDALDSNQFRGAVAGFGEGMAGALSERVMMSVGMTFAVGGSCTRD
jgi:hypothetical protein